MCLVLAPAAQATTLLALDLASLEGSADTIVRGQVTHVSSRWTQGGGRIVTEIELLVVETWKGTAPAKVVVMQPGGIVGDIGQRVDGVASFTPGEEVVVFLEARGEKFTMAGMAQGRFKVERSSDGQAIYARQDQCGELHLVDAVSRQPVSQPPMSMPMDSLKMRVVRTAPSQPAIAPQVTP